MTDPLTAFMETPLFKLVTIIGAFLTLIPLFNMVLGGRSGNPNGINALGFFRKLFIGAFLGAVAIIVLVLVQPAWELSLVMVSVALFGGAPNYISQLILLGSFVGLIVAALFYQNIHWGIKGFFYGAGYGLMLGLFLSLCSLVFLWGRWGDWLLLTLPILALFGLGGGAVGLVVGMFNLVDGSTGTTTSTIITGKMLSPDHTTGFSASGTDFRIKDDRLRGPLDQEYQNNLGHQAFQQSDWRRGDTDIADLFDEVFGSMDKQKKPPKRDGL